MNKIFIDDISFAHAFSSSWYNKPKNFNWERNDLNNHDNIVITNLNKIYSYPNKKVYGWLIEPSSLINDQYEFAKNNYQLFEKIFTYDEKLLQISNKFDFLPIGGCWIEEKDRQIYNKTKKISIISSNKNYLEGHKLRHLIIQQFKNIDLFGTGYNKIEYKLTALKDYMFSIIVENQRSDFLFTEKLIDCFVTGTIPIYWGCPSINKIFDANGIITFESLNDLNNILNQINEQEFKKRIKAIENNFLIAQEYIIADDLIYNKIK